MSDPRRVFKMLMNQVFSLEFTTGRVFTPKGRRNVYEVTSGSKQQITCMVCFNAAGQYLNPIVVFPGQRIRNVDIEDFPEGYMAPQTMVGWIWTSFTSGSLNLPSGWQKCPSPSLLSSLWMDIPPILQERQQNFVTRIQLFCIVYWPMPRTCFNLLMSVCFHP